LRHTFALALLAAVALPALAHDFWIQPSSFRLEPGAMVQIDLRVGEHFRGDPVPRDPARIVAFTLAHDGDSPVAIAGVPGKAPAGLARMHDAGSYLAVYHSNPAFVELEADKFEKYLSQGASAIRAAPRACSGRRAGRKQRWIAPPACRWRSLPRQT
jgi:hypothetical protein